MDIRSELREALDQKDFPSQALLARTLARLDEPAHRRRYSWPAPVATGLIAIALVVTLVIVHLNGQPPALTDDRPMMQVSSSVTGLVSFQWVSSQVAWVNLSAPEGGSVIARTVDGGSTWHRELSLTNLRTPPTAQFFNDREAVVVGQPVQGADRVPVVPAWRTSDGGAHWQEYPFTPDPADIRPPDPRDFPDPWIVPSSYFLDSERGWMLLKRGTAGCSGCLYHDNTVRVFQTIDGGANWTRSATLPGTLGGWLGIRFGSATTGLVWDYRGRLNVTHDGGKSWTAVTLSVPGDPISYPELLLPEPVTFQSASEVLYALDVAKVVKVPPCLPNCRTGTAAQAIARYVFSSSDGALTWARSGEIPIRGELPLPHIEFIDRTHWVVLDADGVTVSTDGGSTWSPPRSIPTPAGWYLNEGQFLDVSRGWVTVSDSAQATFNTAQKANLVPNTPWPKFSILATSDGGASWHQVALPQA